MVDKPREPGYYWIRLDGIDEPIIGYWHSSGFWLTMMDDGQGEEDSNAYVLSEKLQPPG